MSGAMSPSDPSSPTERRYALIVGVNDAPKIVHLSFLKSAEENAKAVAKVLQEHGDWTLLCEPLLGAAATTRAVRDALNALVQKRTDHDILLFYFAGHGSIHEDQTGQRPVFLVTSDFDAFLIEEGEATDSISLGFLHERLYEKTKAGRVVVLLDCCYAGNAGSTAHDLPLDTISNLFKDYLGASNQTASGKYRVTLAATARDVEASEKDDNSMTKHLLSVLRGECIDALDPNGQIIVEGLHTYLQRVMPDKQKPSFSTNGTNGRSIILVTHPEHSAQARQAQQRAAQLYERYERLHVLSAAPDGERFLRDRLESFAGREKELHDIQQRIATVQPSGGYVTITGQAGQGKSSITAALIAQYATTAEEREHIPFHFIPFNPGPEYQVTLLRNLMARLILKYNLSDLYVASESRPALRDFFPKVLSDVAAKGSQEIIFIDGLDQIESELNGVRDLSFLPTNPPEGIVFVLGTRPDDTLKPLTLLKPTQSYLLPPLSRDDFSTLLQRRQVPLLEQRLADQLYEKMQQNALYLDLLARELHNQGPITSNAIEMIIHRLAEDPNNIFSLALERLERRGDWREVIKPLLGILLVAYEPLTPWQLRTILNLDHRQVQNGLQALSGLIMHIEQRYALYHLKFQDFLREDEARPDKPCIFATDEEARYHARLVRWCERDQLSLIWEDTGDSHEQSRRIYVRHYYISHLYDARQWERLFAVLDEQSYGQAKERYDVGARSYVQDLKKGCLAAIWEGWTYEQHLKYLPKLWRYTLLRCSIRSTADRYPLELFEVMLVLGKEREVAGLIELITKADRKVRALLLLGQYLFQLPERKQEGVAIYMRSEEVARSIENISERAWALSALATALAQTQQWKQAELVVRSIQDTYEQSVALSALAIALAQAQQGERAKQFFSQAEMVVRSIEDAPLQARALTALATALAQTQQWSQAELVVRSIEDAPLQVQALTVLATALAQAQQGEYAKQFLSQAEEVISSIEHEYEQARALRALATALAQTQQWKQAEEMVRSIQDAYEQAEALTALAQAQQRERAKQFFSQAERVARSIQDVYEDVGIYEQNLALRSLTIALAQAQQWKKAEEVARSIKDAEMQAEALMELATVLAQAQQWKKAEEVARSIKDAELQVEALTALVTALSQAQQGESAKQFFLQVEGVVRSIEHTEMVVRPIWHAALQAKALTALTSALAQAQQWEQAEKVARSVQDASEQTMALMGLATALAQAQQWKQAEEVARSIQDASPQAWALRALATALAQAQQWKQAEEVARSIEDISEQAKALTALASVLAQTQQWKQAEEVARSIQDTFEQVRALMTLVTALAQNRQREKAKWVLSQAEEVVRSIEHEYEQARVLRALATALAQTQQWKQAEEMVCSIQDAYEQAEALTVLATAFAQSQQRERAKQFFLQAEKVARSIEHASEQAKALMTLATALAQTQQWKQAEGVARSIKDVYGQAWALRSLTIALAKTQQWKKAEEVARSIKGASEQARALITLAIALAQAQQRESAKQFFLQAEEVARSIEHVFEQARALTALATALTEQGYPFRLLSLVQRSWQLVETREEALHLFPLACGLITLTPTLGMELYESFQWMNDFLPSS